MIAYDPLWLNNLNVREQSADAFRLGLLNKEEQDELKNKYPAYFYSPNLFIRIGLFILTSVILLFSFGLATLLFIDSVDKAIAGLAIFFGLAGYAALEYIVQIKKHLRSGVDDALLWLSAGALFGGISYLTNADDLANCIIIFVISLYGVLRFADRVMSILLYISLLAIVFLNLSKMGTVAKAIVPLAIIGISICSYEIAKKLKKAVSCRPYVECLEIMSVATLLSFYLAGNYYVASELNAAMFHLNPDENGPVAFGWLLWIFTTAIPCLYIFRGIQKKDMVLTRTGLLLVAVMIFTVRYYYAVAPVEIMMTLGGISLMLISYGLTRYLKIPQYGYTSLETIPGNKKEKQAIESILLVQTFAAQQTLSDDAKFGGGSFGGGGASGDF